MPKLYYRNPDGSAYPDMGGFGVLAANPPQVQDEQIQTRPAYQGAPIQAPPAYQEPPIDQNEVNARLAMKRLQRDIPSGVRNPDAVVSPFEKIAVMRWKDSNRAKYDEYRAAQDIIDRADATRAARFAALDEQKAVQTNRFQFEDQQLQNELGRFRREDRSGEVAFQNSQRAFIALSQAQQQENWQNENALNKIRLAGAQLGLSERQSKIDADIADTTALRNMASILSQESQGTGRPIASPGLEVADSDGNPVNTGPSVLFGTGVGGQGSLLDRRIANETSMIASAASKAGSPQVISQGIQWFFQDRSQRANEANIAADNARADRMANAQVSLAIRRQQAAEAKWQLENRVKLIKGLLEQEGDIQRQIDKVEFDARGFYVQDRDRLNALKVQRTKIREQRMALEALNSGDNSALSNSESFVHTVGNDGSVLVSVEGGSVYISAKRRRDLSKMVLDQNRGLTPGSDEHLMLLKEAIDRDAIDKARRPIYQPSPTGRHPDLGPDITR